MFNLKNEIIKMIEDERENGWSDLNLKAGQTIAFRNKSGNMVKVPKDENESNIISEDDIFSLVKDNFPDFDNVRDVLDSVNGDNDTSIIVETNKDKIRFRGNIHYFGNRQVGLIMRKINDKAIPIELLGLPELARTFNQYKAGLVLVTGPTGSGKSTSLASLIEEINQNKSLHIITVEDPIEFVFTSDKCCITQREIGANKDSASFNHALRASLRQDPDVILVGEVRDSETAEICMEAAQTGHLVFATLHTKDSTGTISRLISMFESSEQNRVSDILSDVLIGVISQILVPKLDNSGKIMACEVMSNTSAIRNLIKNQKPNNIKSYMVQGQNETGMKLLNQSLIEFVKDKKISPASAKAYCVDRVDMEKQLAENGIIDNSFIDSIKKSKENSENKKSERNISSGGFLKDL